MGKFELSVFIALLSGGTMVHVFTITVPKPLAWVKDHADEMAATFLKGTDYCALNVTELHA